MHRKIFTLIDFEDPLYFKVNKEVSWASTSQQACQPIHTKNLGILDAPPSAEVPENFLYTTFS